MPNEILRTPTSVGDNVGAPVRPNVSGRNTRLVRVLVFVIALSILLFFGFKVLGYYRKIQTGLIDTTSLSFESTQASNASLMSFAKAAPGSGQLATTDDPSLGQPGAKLVIVEFADFGCPFSREESYVVRALAQKYPNDIQVIYRDFPLVDLHPGADMAAEAGECAHEQNKFWEFHDGLYRHTGDYTIETLLDVAASAELDVNDMRVCLESGRYTQEVAQDVADGLAVGVVGTPTFFLNGQKIDGAIPFGVFTSLVETFIAL